MNCETVWASVQTELIAKLDADTYNRYLVGVVPLSLDMESDAFTLGVLNDFVALWLDSNYKTIIAEVLSAVLGTSITVLFESGHTRAAADISSAVAPTIETQPQPDRRKPRSADEDAIFTYRPDFSFDTFVIGNNNRICHAAAIAVSKDPGKAYNPLFVYGGVGLGKTHLLQAIANDVIRRSKCARIRYLTSEEFVNLYVEAMQKKSLPAFRRRLRSLDVLIIDDVQFFEGKVGSSEEFFHTFNTMHNTHKQIVVASDRNPQDMSGLEQRLVSRFEWGLSAEILPPDLETRVAILKKKQEKQSIKFSDDILFLIAKRIRSNIRNLESALTKLIMNISAFGSTMTIDRAEELLVDKFESESSKLLSIEAIQRRVAEYYDIRVADMTSKKRPQNIAMPRMVAMYLSRNLTNFSFPAIGDAFNRNHATILHAVGKIEKKMQVDETFRHAVGQLSRQLRT